jgi:hypothetical protein
MRSACLRCSRCERGAWARDEGESEEAAREEDSEVEAEEVEVEREDDVRMRGELALSALLVPARTLALLLTLALVMALIPLLAVASAPELPRALLSTAALAATRSLRLVTARSRARGAGGGRDDDADDEATAAATVVDKA